MIRRADEEGDVRNERRSSFEKVGSNLLQTIIAALLLWVGNSVIDLKASVVRLEVQYIQARAEIQEVKTQLENIRASFQRLAAEDPSRGTLRGIERRISNLENVGK